MIARGRRLTIQNTFRHWLLLPVALIAAVGAVLWLQRRGSA